MNTQNKYLLIDSLWQMDASAKQIEATLYQLLNFIVFDKSDTEEKQKLESLQNKISLLRQEIIAEAGRINGD